MRHCNRAIFTIALSLALASPAAADEYLAVTPSGTAEAAFPGNQEATSGALSNQCIGAGWTVISATRTSVACEVPMSMMQSAFSQVLIGNSYSTPPRQFYRFSITNYNGQSRVQATSWMELQMVFGQMRRTDFSGPTFHNSAMAILIASGGSFPTGTTFPNHAFVGARFEMAKNPIMGARISELEAGSSADDAGLAVGDIVTRIARKRVKQYDDILDGLAKAVRTKSYEIEVLRAGRKLKFEVETRLRPRAPALNWAERPNINHGDKPVNLNPTPLSVADELAKFVKLRDEEIITDEEFETQKSRLLGLR